MYAGASDGERRVCRFCGVALSGEQAMGGGICGAEACHANMIEESGRAIMARNRRKYDETLARVLDDAADEVALAHRKLGVVEGEAIVAMVPWQDRPLEPLPTGRLAEFREHLQLVTDLAFRDPAPDADLSAREAEEPEEEPEVLAACSTCQGMCCKRGANTALLLPGDIARYRQRNSGVTPDQVIADYLAYLPAASTRDACVYQTERGCNLPRAMRQDICNSYYCDSLRWLRQAWRAPGPGKAVLIAADEGAARQVAAIDGGDGFRIVARFDGGRP